MQPVLWNPFREMEDLMSRFARAPSRALTSAEDLPLATWAPAVDISETDKEYLIRAELPGMKKEEVKLNVQNGVLTLSGERRIEKNEKDEKHHRIERTYGSFTRSFALPEDAVPDRITADVKDGVLNIHLGKTEAPRAKSVEVRIN